MWAPAATLSLGRAFYRMGSLRLQHPRDNAAHWTPRLAGIDAVVNCVGILQGSRRDDAERILRRRSAVSAETGVPTAYAQSKAKADAALALL